MQDDRRHARRPAPPARSAAPAVNGAPGARHLRAAGLGGVDRLVGRERPARRARSGSGSARRGGPGRLDGSGPGARSAASQQARAARGRAPIERRRGRSPGSARTSPARPPRNGRGAGAQLDDASVHQPRAGQRRREVQPSALPSVRRAGSAAGSVADVLTTSRSPGAGSRAGRANARVRELPVAGGRPAGARRRARARAPRAARGPRARAAARTRAGAARRPSGDASTSARAVAPARQVALDQREQPGDAVLGRRPVGDVLARERLLVHARCACRPGRRRRPRSSGCSAASTAVSWSSAAFAAP